MTLGCGLIGAGVMGRELAEALGAGVAEARVVAAYDPHAPALASLRDTFGPEAAGSLQELLARPDIQAVIVATPNHLHCEQTIAAAEAGKHVFCEKPMALSTKDCDRMIAACERAGVKLMVGQSARLQPLARRLLEVARRGELGKPLFGLATYLFTGFRERDSGVWHVAQSSSGGLLFHMAIHQIDLFHALFGPTRRLQYAGGRYGRQVRDFDDVATILLDFASGATGVISASSISCISSCTNGRRKSSSSDNASFQSSPSVLSCFRVMVLFLL